MELHLNFYNQNDLIAAVELFDQDGFYFETEGLTLVFSVNSQSDADNTEHYLVNLLNIEGVDYKNISLEDSLFKNPNL